MATFVDYYAVLGIKPTADLVEIKQAYRQLALQHHPDKAEPGSKPDSTKFISAQAAYEVLVDASKRQAYDIERERLSKPAGPSSTAYTSYHGETSGGFGGGFWSHPARDSDGIHVPGAFPSDSSDDYVSEYEDPGVYEDLYADTDGYYYYNPFGMDGRRFRSCYGGDVDSTDNEDQFPDESVEDASPAQGSGNESEPDSESHRDVKTSPPRIPAPFSEAFDRFAKMIDSHYSSGEKVKGRTHQMALDELRLQKRRCKDLDTQLNDLDARLRRRVGAMPADSVNADEFDKPLKRRMDAAHRAVREVQLETEHAIFVVRFEEKPQTWSPENKTTRSIVNTIQRNAVHLSQMKNGLAGMEYIVAKMEGWANSDLKQLKGSLDNFMCELRDWCEEIAARA